MAKSIPVKMQQALESGSVFQIELYEIHLPTTTLYLCSCDQNITYNGQLYIAMPIERGEISKTVDSQVDNCELSIANTTEYFTQAIFEGINFIGSRVYIYKILYPDSLSDPSQITMLFYGSIDSPELTNEGTFKIQLVSDIPTATGGRILQYPCNSTFGDSACQHSIQTVSGVVLSANQRTLQLSNFDGNNTTWKNGLILCNSEGRRIVAMNGSTITVEYPFLQNVHGLTYTVKQDCDKTTADCDRLNNRIHYGGFTAVPYEYQVKG